MALLSKLTYCSVAITAALISQAAARPLEEQAPAIPRGGVCKPSQGASCAKGTECNYVRRGTYRCIPVKYVTIPASTVTVTATPGIGDTSTSRVPTSDKEPSTRIPTQDPEPTTRIPTVDPVITRTPSQDPAPTTRTLTEDPVITRSPTPDDGAITRSSTSDSVITRTVSGGLKIRQEGAAPPPADVPESPAQSEEESAPVPTGTPTPDTTDERDSEEIPAITRVINIPGGSLSGGFRRRDAFPEAHPNPHAGPAPPPSAAYLQSLAMLQKREAQGSILDLDRDNIPNKADKPVDRENIKIPRSAEPQGSLLGLDRDNIPNKADKPVDRENIKLPRNAEPQGQLGKPTRTVILPGKPAPTVTRKVYGRAPQGSILDLDRDNIPNKADKPVDRENIKLPRNAEPQGQLGKPTRTVIRPGKPAPTVTRKVYGRAPQGSIIDLDRDVIPGKADKPVDRENIKVPRNAEPQGQLGKPTRTVILPGKPVPTFTRKVYGRAPQGGLFDPSRTDIKIPRNAEPQGQLGKPTRTVILPGKPAPTFTRKVYGRAPQGGLFDPSRTDIKIPRNAEPQGQLGKPTRTVIRPGKPAPTVTRKVYGRAPQGGLFAPSRTNIKVPRAAMPQGKLGKPTRVVINPKPGKPTPVVTRTIIHLAKRQGTIITVTRTVIEPKPTKTTTKKTTTKKTTTRKTTTKKPTPTTIKLTPIRSTIIYS